MKEGQGLPLAELDTRNSSLNYSNSFCPILFLLSHMIASFILVCLGKYYFLVLRKGGIEQLLLLMKLNSLSLFLFDKLNSFLLFLLSPKIF